jgi:hypothetical protein
MGDLLKRRPLCTCGKRLWNKWYDTKEHQAFLRCVYCGARSDVLWNYVPNPSPPWRPVCFGEMYQGPGDERCWKCKMLSECEDIYFKDRSKEGGE